MARNTTGGTMKLFRISSYFVEYSHERPASHIRLRRRGVRRRRMVGDGAGSPSTRRCERIPPHQIDSADLRTDCGHARAAMPDRSAASALSRSEEHTSELQSLMLNS